MQCGQVKDGLSAPGKKRQIIPVETGQFAQRVRSANAAYGFGRGVDAALTREQAMTLKVFTNDVLDDFFK